MTTKRYFAGGVLSLVLAAALTATSALGADILYVGDGADNTVKRFDADTGAFLDGDSDETNNPDAFVRPGDGGLNGPRGILFDGNLLLANQNAELKMPGEILRYDGETGAFQGALVASSDKYAPFAPRGIVLDGDLYVANLISGGGRGTGSVDTYGANGDFLGSLTAKGFQNKDYHPRALVFGPDGDLYVSVRDLKRDGLGGHVLRFGPDGSVEVFIADAGGPGRLNRPEGLAFGPDGNLYVTSFRAGPGDTDAIRVYSPSGDFLRKIDLFDAANDPRVYAQALLFGPDGCLFVPINNTGEVRRYNVGAGSCDAGALDDYKVLVEAGAELKQPWYLTFGRTDPRTLDYLD